MAACTASWTKKFWTSKEVQNHIAWAEETKSATSLTKALLTSPFHTPRLMTCGTQPQLAIQLQESVSFPAEVSENTADHSGKVNK